MQDSEVVGFHSRCDKMTHLGSSRDFRLRKKGRFDGLGRHADSLFSCDSIIFNQGHQPAKMPPRIDGRLHDIEPAGYDPAEEDG